MDHLTFEGGPGCRRFEKTQRKKILQSLFKNREKHCPVRKKLLHKPILQLSSTPPPSLKVKWTKLISSRMDFEPHIKKVRLSSYSPFSYKKCNENLFLAAADDVLGRIFRFSFDPIRPSTIF